MVLYGTVLSQFSCVLCRVQTFTEEVVAHQADLRYITMCANRFAELAKVSVHSVQFTHRSYLLADWSDDYADNYI